MAKHDRRYFFRCTNENSVVGFETNEEGIVVKAAPMIYKAVMGLEMSKALEVLRARGWKVEDWTDA